MHRSSKSLAERLLRRTTGHQFFEMTGRTIHKNGNINQLMWRTRGRERQAYNFAYDPAGAGSSQ